MVDKVYYDIPVEYRDRYRELLNHEPVPFDELRAEVQGYLDTVREVAKMVTLLDIGQAERLGEIALRLLDHVDDEPGEARSPVQAAVRYLILEEDDEEITGVLGFSDDIQVMNAVSRALGRPDMVMSVDDTTS